MKLAIFSHGKESGPHGTKIKKLRNIAEAQGFETIALDYTECHNATERISKLKECIENKNAESLVLVGSSMGGYISTVLSSEYTLMGLFLLCPALYMTDEEYKVQHYIPKCHNIEIIHGWEDDVVPFANSITFGQQTKAVINLVDDDHRLKKSYSFLENRFDSFLKNLN